MRKLSSYEINEISERVKSSSGHWKLLGVDPKLGGFKICSVPETDKDNNIECNQEYIATVYSKQNAELISHFIEDITLLIEHIAVQSEENLKGNNKVSYNGLFAHHYRENFINHLYEKQFDDTCKFLTETDKFKTQKISKNIDKLKDHYYYEDYELEPYPEIVTDSNINKEKLTEEITVFNKTISKYAEILKNEK